MSKFAPLHIISGYSFLKSGLTVEKISSGIVANKYYGAGITDEGVLYGLPTFAHALEQRQLPYILGMDVIIDGANLSLFVLNDDGYQSILAINNLIQKEQLSLQELEKHSDGLLCVIESNHGSFKENFLKEEAISEIFTKYLLSFSKIFKDEFYIGNEVTSKEEVKYANSVRKFAKQYGYKCVAFPRIKYLKKDDAIILKIVKAIADQDKDFKEKKLEGQEYFMTEDAYSKIYNVEELANTIEIINKSTFKLEKQRGEMLHYPVENSEQALRDNCFNELNRLGLGNDERYINQLNHELDVIISMGYPDYFLLVQDYVLWAKNNDILVGPGRGSAAGSLVSYLLKITEIDPLKYNLQFERFLNPYRQTLPDIDVDFMDIRRDAVVEYMRQKYGKDKVANIVAFQTFKAKQSIRDIGRIYNYPERHISLISKTLSNPKYSLAESYRNLPEFKNLVDSDEYFKEIVSLAYKIEGLPRQSGQHAAGVVFNNKSISEHMPVTNDFNDNCISQYEAKYLEEQHFLKMDFLGLRNLTAVYVCVELINAHNKGLNLSKYDIPYDTPEIFELISSGQTMGLFQIDTATMKRGIKTIKPSCFEDVVALLALNRPGPMQFIKNYADRRDGKEKITYLSKALEKILAPTYGIIIYQEQINQIATVMAGFTPGEADVFRRAISKKEKDKMVAYEKQFIDGSIKNGYTENEAKNVFEHILKFANYGFNRSHSVVYAVLACRMAWLKAHYPLEFYTAVLETGSSSNEAKFSDYLEEMKKRGMKILPPSINKSGIIFQIEKDSLLFPLSFINGVNELLVNNIVKERTENGPFKGFFDFAVRMYSYKINESQFTALVNSGALDEFYKSRASMLSTIKNALRYAEICCSEDGQLNIGIAPYAEPAMVEEDDDPLTDLDKEFEALGIMLSKNPLEFKQDLLKEKNVTYIQHVPTYGQVNVCGIIKKKKIIKTRKGSSMAFVTIYDQTGELEITVFPSVFELTNSILDKNNIIVVKGRYDGRGADISFVGNEIALLED